MTNDEAFNEWWCGKGYDSLRYIDFKPAKAAWNAALEYAKAKQPHADWANAPEWAMFKAEDFDGDVCWYQYKPENEFGRWGVDRGRCVLAYRNPRSNPDWQSTLEERPK